LLHLVYTKARVKISLADVVVTQRGDQFTLWRHSVKVGARSRLSRHSSCGAEPIINLIFFK